MNNLELLTSVLVAAAPQLAEATPISRPAIEVVQPATTIDNTFYQALDDSLRARGIVTQVNDDYMVDFVSPNGVYRFQGIVLMQHENPGLNMVAPIAKLAPILSPEDKAKELADKQAMGYPLNSDDALLFLYRGDGAVTNAVVEEFLMRLDGTRVPNATSSMGQLKARF